MASRIIRKTATVLLAASFATSGWQILPEAMDAVRVYRSFAANPDVLVDYQMERVPPEDYARHAGEALAANDPELADSIRTLANSRGVALPEELDARVDAALAGGGKSTAADVWDGVVNGEPEGWEGYAAMVASDFVVIGDVRDLVAQAEAYPDYDPFTVALAGTGIVLTGVTVGTIAATWLTGGAAAPSVAAVAPAKVGVSVLKAAKKMGKLDPALLDELTATARRTVDGDALGSLKGHAWRLDWDGFLDAAGKAVRKEEVADLGKTAEALGGIAKGQGLLATVQALGAAKSAQEVQRLGRLSEKFGTGFRGFLKVVPKAARASLKGLDIASAMVMWAVSGLLWMLWAGWYLFRAVRFAAVRFARPAPGAS
ncbi:hypothetical protein [Mesorhizobium mediterraneum]|uniref:hypothetical protein n=1 Tax=Mesorhizobium mediterraneum TaxID=43617 RepID=UPI0017816384|nr:hypothetical protein [Mesorhizobium mediterraneum]